MDVYLFIDSKDIRNYLQKIKYEFTVPETAFLIYMSRRATLNEKLDAWQEIIDTMPDCSMGERINMGKISSFHRFLTEYIALLKNLLDTFYKSEKAVYTYSFYEKEGNWTESVKDFEWVEEGKVFSDYQTAFSHLKKNYLQDSFERLRFIKQYFSEEEDESGKKLTLEMNHDLELLSVDEQGVLNDSQTDLFLTFEGMWFAFPTPFRRGDILINPFLSKKPFVLHDIRTWGSKEMLANGYAKEDGLVKNADRTIERLMKNGDTSDMNYSGCYIGEDARNGFYIFSEVFWNYLYLERYTQPLKGEQRALAALASYHSPDREERIGEDLLSNSVHYFFMEEQCRRNRKLIEREYTSEGKKLAGLEVSDLTEGKRFSKWKKSKEIQEKDKNKNED